MAQLILLDTDIVLDYLLGVESATQTEGLLTDGNTALSAVTVFELFAGVQSPRHIRQRGELLELCEVLPVTKAVARSAAQMYTDLKAAGSLIPNEDLLIAATALETPCPLLTRNRSHFDRIPGLLLY